MKKSTIVIAVISLGLILGYGYFKEEVKEPPRISGKIVENDFGQVPPELPPQVPQTIEEMLEGKTQREKANIKGREIAKLRSIEKQRVQFSGADYRIQVVEMNEIEGGVELFARAWTPNGQQIGFGKNGSVDIERFVIINPPVLVGDVNGEIARIGLENDGSQIVRKLREDPRQAILQDLAHTIGIMVKRGKVAHIGTNITPNKKGNTTLTVRPNASTGTAPIDGQMSKTELTGETFASIRDTGDASNDTTANGFVQLRADGATNCDTECFDILTRQGYGFNTSSIGSDTIDDATVSWWGRAAHTDQLGSNANMNVTSFSPADESDFVNADYDVANYGTADFSTDVAVSSFSNGSYQDFAYNATGIADISTGANTFVALRIDWDIDASFGGTFATTEEVVVRIYDADQTGTDNDPKLVVNHSSGAAAITHPFWSAF